MRQLGILQSLVFVILLFSCSLEAAYIQKIQGKRVLIKLDGMSVELGQRVAAIHISGNLTELVIVESAKKLPSGYAVGEFYSGQASVGDRVLSLEAAEQERKTIEERKTKKSKLRKRSGFTIKAGIDTANTFKSPVTYAVDTGSGAVLVDSFSSNQPFYFYYGYSSVQNEGWGWGLGIGSEQRSLSATGLSASNISFSGLEFDINYGFEFLNELSYVQLGLLSYVGVNEDYVTTSGKKVGFSMTGTALGFGSYFNDKFYYELSVRTLKDTVNVTLSGLLLRVGYVWSD